MKFVSLLAVLPILALVVSAEPQRFRGNGSNQRGNNNGGGRRGGRQGQGQGGRGKSGGAANRATTTTAVSTTSAATTTSSTALAGNTGLADAAAGNGNKGGNAGNNGNGNNGGNNNNTGNNGGNNNNNGGNNGNPQTSLQLDPAVIGAGLAQNGQSGTPDPGQVASLTSTNNYINFCLGQTITDGKQVIAGSCNPVPQGQIPAKTNMPSCKFVNPPNGATIPANKNFTIALAIKNLQTGFFVNAATNYYSAPQQLNGQGIIQGHSHVVVEKLPSLSSTVPTDPTVFAFFKGLNDKAANGVLTATVAGGLPAGAYKVSSINTNANHAPVLAPVAQHGSMDDVSYFTVQ